MASFSLVMIGVSICMFLIAVALNDHEIMNVAVLAFTENVLAILSAVFMAIGFCLAIFSHFRRKTQRRGHFFETAPRRARRSH